MHVFWEDLCVLTGFNIFLNPFAEAFRAPIFRTGADKDGFSLGKYNNFQEVFGDNRKMWFLPVFTR
jgi:palmitoyltransferase